jgi:hypothetical protein
MATFSFPLLMIVMDLMMIIYIPSVVSALKPTGAIGNAIGIGMFAWPPALHLGLSRPLLFPADISGPMPLAGIFVGVFAVVVG